MSAFVGVFTALALESGGITGRVWNNDDGTVEILAKQTHLLPWQNLSKEIQQRDPHLFQKVSYLDVQLSNFPPTLTSKS